MIKIDKTKCPNVDYVIGFRNKLYGVSLVSLSKSDWSILGLLDFDWMFFLEACYAYAMSADILKEGI